MQAEMSRRDFVVKTSLIIAGTVVGSRIQLFSASSVQASSGLPFRPHAFLEIGADNAVTVWVGQTNLGQGTHTGIPMIIADELDAAWENVGVKMALAAEPFKDPFWHAQVTGGSSSIRNRWDLLRTVGAAARLMLLQTAAEKWNVPVEQCSASEGKVLHQDGRSFSYGQLAPDAGKRSVPENPTLKKPEDYKIIGTSPARFDLVPKVLGQTVYGIDFTLPGMCTALVARPTRFGAELQSYDAAAAQAIKGVVKVVPLENRVAVCAETTYAAMKGRDALRSVWSAGPHSELDDAALEKAYVEYLEKGGAVADAAGNIDEALAQSSTTIEQSYKLPYLSHAQVEPINCTAHVEKDLCRIWVPTQGQTQTQYTAAQLTGLLPEKVEVMTLPAGGGFGLRSEQEAVVDSVLLSKSLARPVKVLWSREDDFAYDYYRPASLCRIKGGLDKEGKIIAWSHKVAAPSVMSRLMPDYVKDGIDPDAVSGIKDLIYNIPNKRVDYVLVDLPVPVGFWRSVGYSVNTFTVESFMDELAHAAGKDSVQFRLDHLEKGSRPYKILSLLAEKGGWGDALAEKRARGVAVTSCFESFAAHMAEISVGKGGKIIVHKMICAIDCGTAVFPDAICAQAEAGVIMGMSAAFHEKMQFVGGGVKTDNYDSYRVLSMSEVPEIEVHIAPSGAKAGGVGEPVLPAVAPAIANAVFKATGVRLRELPFKTELLS